MNFEVVTDFPIAYDSPDHLVPLGTKEDNSRNSRFLRRCYALLEEMGKEKGLILDLGCSGGGCVEDFFNDGHDAWGLEGSDYSRKLKRASWATIPDRLYTCDLSRPFLIRRDDSILKFDIIYSFEVMEHITKARLSIYFANIYNHLADDGIFIGSFTCVKSRKFPDHHQSILTWKQWRRHIIKSLGIFEVVHLKWKHRDYLRFSPKRDHCIPIAFRKIRPGTY